MKCAGIEFLLILDISYFDATTTEPTRPCGLRTRLQRIMRRVS